MRAVNLNTSWFPRNLLIRLLRGLKRLLTKNKWADLLSCKCFDTIVLLNVSNNIRNHRLEINFHFLFEVLVLTRRPFIGFYSLENFHTFALTVSYKALFTKFCPKNTF